MRQRWLIVFLAAIASLALLAAACGSDSTPAAPNSDDSGSETSDRQSGDEPVGRVVTVSLSGQKLAAGPVCPHAVELFAHPPTVEIDVILPALGE